MERLEKLISLLINEDDELSMLFEIGNARDAAYHIVNTNRPPDDDGWYIRWRLPSIQDYFESIFSQVKWAKDNLTDENIGRVIVWIGSCPSGPTVAGYVKWDGSEEALTEIARHIVRHSGCHAWKAYPAWEDKERDTIWFAEMRTMDI